MTADRVVAALGLTPHPEGGWQAARTLGAPAFRCDGFELAPPGWDPPG